MDFATRVYRVRKTCLEMLGDRGYLVPQDELTATLEAFKMKYGEQPRKEELTLLIPKMENHRENIFVFFPEEEKVGVTAIKTIADRMKAENVGRALMVIASKLTPFAKATLQQMESKYKIEIFLEQELLVNITKHVLVPEHRVLKDNEKKTLLAQYKVKESQLPRIQLNDPVARYYGMVRGQVVRIVRASETAGRYVTYRIAC
ncbi:unnamed protein product [Ostreobium quekettii]|uniref:DNA-directed RNA polymerases I, II, and III subunit RPABC1 n=1 Tax=Ostreobium quekettii TaxID=121088 RepID=A0A8S1ISW7_9CHLO|nr:unnamed protein product [Ostreobium quekettii]|eukprot:evm.model.scf_414EXC.3 EVM.evm.TU.scf_414EXC.3   scf_414EXC:18918-22118(+)